MTAAPKRPLLSRDLFDLRDLRLALLRAAVGAVQGALVGAWWGAPFAAAGAVTGLLAVVPAFVEGEARRRGLPTHGACFEWAIVTCVLSVLWGLFVGSQAGWAFHVVAEGSKAARAFDAELLGITAMGCASAAPCAAAATFLRLDGLRPAHRHGCLDAPIVAGFGLVAAPFALVYLLAGLLDRAIPRRDA